MAITFENMLGIHQHTLGVRTRNAELISQNIANSDTPGYKAKGLDFQSALNQAQRSNSGGYSLNRTHDKHFEVELNSAAGAEKYRSPTQPDTGDGNTVDAQLEQNLYMQNALEYQMTMSFLDSRISGVKKAISGTGGQ